MDMPAAKPTEVALFVTCLVDLYRPTVAFAAVKLLERAGCRVVVPATQTCCGQPAYNNGDQANARAIARQVITAFESYSHVVAPSGSCAGMLRHHYPALFAEDPAWAARARRLAERSHELVSFLADVMGFAGIESRHAGIATYHDSCSGLRELGVKRQPRALLGKVRDLALREMPGAESCCGFGGTFCVKYSAISDRIVADKAKEIIATGADTLLAGDMGCLLHMAGKLSREGAAIKVRHVAELLAGMTDRPAIGEEKN